MTTIARCKGFGTIFAVVLFFAALPAFTANDTWTGAVNGDFSNASNWSGGNVPGNTSSGATVNTDIATFTTNVVNNIVNIDSGRSVARFFFGASELPYVFNGGPLYVFSHTNVNHNANATFRFMPGSLANKSVTFNVPIIGASTGSASNRNIYFTGLGGNANIALGVMYNVNGNLTTGNISGGGSVIFDNGAVAVVRGSINNPAGTANSSVSLDFTGPAVWFKNNDNPFRGSLGLTRGIALFETVTQVAGGNSALGNPANATLGNITMSSTTGGAMLYYVGRDAAGHSSDRNIFTANDSRYLAILSSSGVGNLTWTGNVRPVAPSTSNYSFLYLAGHNTGENVFSGVMSDTTNGSFTLALGLRKRGEGTWNLTAANLNTSTNWLNAGLLRLDFAAAGAPVNNILNSVSPMMLNSGVLALRGKVATANTQTVNGTILREGSTSIEMTPGSNGGTVTLNLGALTRNSSIGTTMTGHVLNISNPSGTTATTTHTGTTNGVLTINETAFATVNKTDWAALSSGNIVALSSYQTSTDPAGWSASDNVSLAVNPDTNIGAGVVINTLRLTGSSALTLDGNFSVGASGILITGGTANISGGNLIGGGNQTERELIIIQNSPNTATISSLIRNGTLSGNMHLTKAGSGRLDLTGNHSGVSGRYLETTVAAGILAVPNRNALGNSTLKFAGGQVGLTNSDITFRAAT